MKDKVMSAAEEIDQSDDNTTVEDKKESVGKCKEKEPQPEQRQQEEDRGQRTEGHPQKEEEEEGKELEDSDQTRGEAENDGGEEDEGAKKDEKEEEEPTVAPTQSEAKEEIGEAEVRPHKWAKEAFHIFSTTSCAQCESAIFGIRRGYICGGVCNLHIAYLSSVLISSPSPECHISVHSKCRSELSGSCLPGESGNCTPGRGSQ